MIKMERNVYEAVQCAPLSEKDEEIHTRKIFYLRGLETRLSYHVKSNIPITNRFILGLLINLSTLSVFATIFITLLDLHPEPGII